MTQYDAGPGDWSDREWELPDRKSKPQARRRRVTLPPWALLAILVGIIIVLCVGLVLAVRAIKESGERRTLTPALTSTVQVAPTRTSRPVTPTAIVTPTGTVELPIGGTPETPAPGGIKTGATVLVRGTLGAGLNLREQPTTYARVVGSTKEGAALTVLEGPRDSDGYVWWRLRTADGKEGWAAANWLVLKTGP